MKKIVLVLSLFLVGCNSTSIDNTTFIPSNKVQVVLMYGQSNMEGHTYKQYLINTMGEEKTLKYKNGFDDVKISYACTISNNTSNKEFVPVQLGQGYNQDRFGPEVGMAEIFSNYNLQDKVYLIKFAQGATSLYNSWRSPSSKMTGSLYRFAIDYTLEQLAKLENMGYYPEVKAICWMQGEDDSSSNYYGDYYQYEKAFISDLRASLNYYSSPKGIGFIDAGISDCPAWTHFLDINNAKMKLADEDNLNVYFSTIDEELKYNGEPAGSPDIYHYDSSSMIKLGNIFAQKIVENFLDL